MQHGGQHPPTNTRKHNRSENSTVQIPPPKGERKGGREEEKHEDEAKAHGLGESRARWEIAV